MCWNEPSPIGFGASPDGDQASIPCADLLRIADNLERYPFVSATMAEAGKLAANTIRNIVNDAGRV